MTREDAYYKIPVDCIGGFPEAWTQYRLPAAFDKPPTVLDLGSNAGAFALWSSIALRAQYVTCYEPNIDLIPYLQWNAERALCPIGINACGVGDPSLNRLYKHGNCPVLFSQYPVSCGRETADFLDVQIIHPSQLKPHDLVKIDTEGAEGFICENLPFTPGMLLVEYHTDGLRQRVDAALSETMTLAESTFTKRGEGILKYVKQT